VITFPSVYQWPVDVFLAVSSNQPLYIYIYIYIYICYISPRVMIHWSITWTQRSNQPVSRPTGPTTLTCTCARPPRVLPTPTSRVGLAPPCSVAMRPAPLCRHASLPRSIATHPGPTPHAQCRMCSRVPRMRM
jgi:hypothetical protein